MPGLGQGEDLRPNLIILSVKSGSGQPDFISETFQIVSILKEIFLFIFLLDKANIGCPESASQNR